ncbi:MAG: hypothetical protein ABSE73_30565 [Planctomycetota bacterium]
MRMLSCSLLLLSAPLLVVSGCTRPEMPSITGEGKLHDLTQVRKGMSPNEVRRVMGSNYKDIYEEGIQGMDGGNHIWEYPEGRVYFNMDNVTRVLKF